jgi:hypothetical protein
LARGIALPTRRSWTGRNVSGLASAKGAILAHLEASLGRSMLAAEGDVLSPSCRPEFASCHMQDRPIRGIPRPCDTIPKLASDILDELPARIVLLTRCCGFDGPARWSIRFVCPGDLRPRSGQGCDATSGARPWCESRAPARVASMWYVHSKAFWAPWTAEDSLPAGPAFSLSTLCTFTGRRPPECAAERPVQRGTPIDTINSGISAIG